MRQQDESHVNAFDAKTHLSELLRQAEQGRSITITRHGKPVARLVPVAGSPAVGVSELITSFRAVRQAAGRPLRIRQLIREGRKH